MEIGIIGWEGFVGSAFYEVFSKDRKYHVTGIGRKNYDAAKGTRFDILINCNGNTSKRLAETEPVKDFEMNAVSTMRILHDFPSKAYVHISTIEVYNDTSSHEKTREDSVIEPDLLSNYGFSKYIGELIARKYAKKWLILRLGGMVGKNMKKGPAYDILTLHKLFVSEKSEYLFINTAEVARIAKLLAERGRWGGIYNVVGNGSVALEKFAQLAGVKLAGSGKEVRKFSVSTEKITGETDLPTSQEAVSEFLKNSR